MRLAEPRLEDSVACESLAWFAGPAWLQVLFIWDRDPVHNEIAKEAGHHIQGGLGS